MAFSASYKQVDVLVDTLDKQLIFQLIYWIERVMNMLLPAMLYREPLLNGLKRCIYDDEMFFILAGMDSHSLRYPMNLTGIITDMLFLTGIM